MVNAILDINQEQQALESPLDRFRSTLKASRKFQADAKQLGHDRVDLYFENVEGNWLESWQEDK